MAPRELPEYLRPVPGPGEGPASASAAEAAAPEQPSPEPSGLIAPTQRGHSGAFVTDARLPAGRYV